MSKILGYVIVTAQDDGTWAADWDGLTYQTFEHAQAEVDRVRRRNAHPAGEIGIVALCTVDDTP